MTGEPIDVGDLLTIDVGAELRKLSHAQLQGPWQIPAELVRRALARGAREVDVELGRHHARVRDDGTGLVPEALRWTAALLDVERPDAERHAALGALEARGELPLLAIAGMATRSLAIRARASGVVHVLEHEQGRTHIAETPSPGPDGTEVILQATGLDRRACRDWLATAARFAEATVRVDGEPVPRGLTPALAQATLRPPLRGRIAIPTEGDTAHAWLLEHGVVTDRVAIPDAPCFEATLELGTDGPGGGAARLREAILPFGPALVDQAVGLLLFAADHGGPLPEPARARLARLLLRAARSPRHAPAVMRAAVFRAVDAAGERLVDLATLERAGHRAPPAPRTLRAIYPGQRAAPFLLGESLVLIADEAERSLLADRLQVGFEAPDALDAPEGLSATLRRALDATADRLARLLDLARHPLRGRPLPDDVLADDEQALLARLRRHLAEVPAHAGTTLAICEGAGPIRRPRGHASRLLLPRDNPTVRAAVAAVARDARWTYPAWLALLDGFIPPPADLRRAWTAPGSP